MPARRLFTIGYQGAALDQLVACLRANAVRTLADIRYHPYSRRPEFRQAPLRAAIEQAGLAYRHLKALGNPPPSRDAAMAGDEAAYHRLFQAHLDTQEARASLQAVLDWTQAGPVCLMCLERDPQDCHRLMVADRLVAETGIALEHLKPEAKEAAQLRLL